MSYGSNYYNYQIAVVFAILIVALLILGAFVLGIYYVFVVNARNKNKPSNGGGARTRTPSSIPATRTTSWQPQLTQQHAQPTPTTPYSPEFQRPLPQDYNYDPRMQPGYIQQQPLVQQQPNYSDYGGGGPKVQQQPNYLDYGGGGPKVRELQPEYVYQQGPLAWTTTQQVTETYPVSPVQQIGGGQSSAAYHMSSV